MRHHHGTSYATTSDYRWFTDDEPDELTRGLLVAASRRIDRALLGACYDVDDAGLPTDSDVTAALRDATCAQAEDWIDSGDLGTGNGVTYSDLAIGSVKVTRNGGASGNQPAGIDIARKALDILFGVGLLPVDPMLVG